MLTVHIVYREGLKSLKSTEYSVKEYKQQKALRLKCFNPTFFKNSKQGLGSEEALPVRPQTKFETYLELSS
jgi:hypothetical protein